MYDRNFFGTFDYIERLQLQLGMALIYQTHKTKATARRSKKMLDLVLRNYYLLKDKEEREKEAEKLSEKLFNPISEERQTNDVLSPNAVEIKKTVEKYDIFFQRWWKVKDFLYRKKRKRRNVLKG